MANILSIEPIEKSPTLNLIKKTWGQLNSLDKFTKLMVISVSLFVISTPFIVANRQVLISRGQTATSIPTPTSSFPTPIGDPCEAFGTCPTPTGTLPPTPTSVVTAAGISAASLTTGQMNNANNATTSIVTIGANKLALIWVAQGDGNSGPTTLSDPNRTWTQITSNTAGLRRLTLYRSLKTTNTTGAITITSPASTGLMWSLAQYSNVNVSGDNGSGAIAQFASKNYKDAGGARSLSGSVNLLSSSLVGSAVAGGFAMGKTSSIFSGAGYALTGVSACTISLCVQAEFRNNFAQLVNMNWSSIAHWIVIAAELKAQ